VADERALNFMLSIVKGVQPRDQLEAMLATQMAAIHELILTYARRLAHTETMPQQDSAERALNKLARTFTTQMEALKRYRSSGEQKVTVQHVSVSDGGQAIVGNVTQAARETAALPKPEQAPMMLTGEPEHVPLMIESGHKAPRRRKRKK
jgi:transcriptional regulator with AAA-type ATPase domain